ncbi:hypothetical protein ADICYQ_4259 [Cyclobacterium qasimii M12-11B]|uniref:Uncharacterized protein n=1 Tax=Cyclobacterium qasimii M12-11B TaxID=641524 RepID=S7VAW1_9BACT|nr:hypothetical protein ADICYQ_4259 [Cyclobacterium qasimii M12-11B]
MEGSTNSSFDQIQFSFYFLPVPPRLGIILKPILQESIELLNP